MTTSRRILHRIRNISDQPCRENKNTYKLNKNFSEDFSIYELTWKNMVEADRPQVTVQYGPCALHAG
jgi:hypothetical protein